MLWTHPAQPGRALRLAYCMNLHPAEDAAGVREGIEAICLPLRDRLSPGEPFGIGMYLPARAAAELAVDSKAREDLKRFLERERLVPFTYNAFPYGGFHRAGLKQGVFSPNWGERARFDYTLAVATLAQQLVPAGLQHISISTHCGRFGAWGADVAVREAALNGLRAAGSVLARMREAGQTRVVLALEPEPRSSANDTVELEPFLRDAWGPETPVAGGPALTTAGDDIRLRSHIGVCLDACHLAVEFEEPGAVLARLERLGASIGKLQYSSALALARPGEHAAARAELLAMAEPVYLHQVTARRGGELLRSGDLPEVAAAIARGGRDESGWLDADEWRCHFHVPVDLASKGGLSTTRAQADQLLVAALEPGRKWGSDELHVEIETYTWQVLSERPPSAPELVDGLEREYRHVFGLLERLGWSRSSSGLRRG